MKTARITYPNGSASYGTVKELRLVAAAYLKSWPGDTTTVARGESWLLDGQYNSRGGLLCIDRFSD